MPRRNNSWLSSILLVSLISLTLPALAHKVKVNKQVGATLHIEPADRARANEQTLIWFALTKKGGQIIPLSHCDCQFKVFKLPGKTAVLQPALQPINAEKYQGIPSAQVLFKEPGAYRLELSGRPRAGQNFQSFRLQFELTVAPGKAGRQ